MKLLFFISILFNDPLFANINLILDIDHNGKQATIHRKNLKFNKNNKFKKHGIEYDYKIIRQNLAKDLADRNSILLDISLRKNGHLLDREEIETFYDNEAILEKDGPHGVLKIKLVAEKTSPKKSSREQN